MNGLLNEKIWLYNHTYRGPVTPLITSRGTPCSELRFRSSRIYLSSVAALRETTGFPSTVQFIEFNLIQQPLENTAHPKSDTKKQVAKSDVSSST